MIVFEGNANEELKFPPKFGNLEVDLNDFEYYFEKPRTRTLHIKENQVSNVLKAKMFKKYKIKEFIRRLEKRFGLGLEIAERKKIF